MTDKKTSCDNDLSGDEYLQYSALAPYYDKLNSEVDYSAWANFLCETISKYYDGEANLVLELGCGTGNITRKLAELGFDMIGIDLSEDMLAVAMQKESESAFLCDVRAVDDSTECDEDRAVSRPLYLCQDMRSFELYGTVDAVVSCLDCTNYLIEDGDLEQCFSLVHNYLNPEGIFIFDVNSPYKFENIFACNDFILERDGLLCAWRNNYDAESELCDFDLSLFARADNGKWNRFDEFQTERCYNMDYITSVLKKTGFELIRIVSDIDGSGVDEKSERWFFIAKAVK